MASCVWLASRVTSCSWLWRVTPAFAVLTLVLVLGSAGVVFGQDRPDVFGIGAASGGWTLMDPPGYDQAVWERLAQAGAASTRIGASWPDIEPVRGTYDWSGVDGSVANCQQYGIAPYCLIVNTPGWASPTGEDTHAWPPLEQYAPDFEAFCTALAARYAGQITYFEFWNEENGYGWHTDGGFNRADEYVPWLRRAYNALKLGNPNCVVGLGGMDDPDIEPGDPTGWRGAYYLNRVYYYRDLWYPGEEIFDAVGDHPYTVNVLGDLPQKLDAIRNVLISHGDGHKPLWLTEYGWNTRSVTQQQQAELLEQFFSVLLTYSSVTEADYLAIGDFETGREGWGLSDQNLRPKPAFYAFQAFPRSDAPQISRVSWRPVDSQTIEVLWETHIPATSQVEYGLTFAYGNQTDLDESLVTQHEVAVSGLDPGSEYHLRVLASAPGVPDSSSCDDVFRSPDATVPNGGFEEGFGPGIGKWWMTFGRGYCTDGALVEGGVVYAGLHSQTIICNGAWDEYMDDGLYTWVAVPTGWQYTFSASTRVDTHKDDHDNLYRKIGTDPTGGTDPDAPDVVWSAQSSIEETWEEMSVSATAQADVVTVFFRTETMQQLPNLYFFYADDAQVTVEDPRAPADFDGDSDVDQADFGHFQACLTGPHAAPPAPGCEDADLTGDGTVHQGDFSLFQQCMSGANVPADPHCAD